SSDELAEAVRQLRNHGGVDRYQHERIGTNSRLDSLQAVVLSAKLRRLDEWNEERRVIASAYHQSLADVAGVTLPPVGPREGHVYHQFVVQVEDRDRVFADMAASGIGVGIHYPTPVHLLPAFRAHELGSYGSFPVAEAQAQRIISLPIYPGLPVEAVERVVSTLRDAVG